MANPEPQKVLVTGTAGFIGFHLAVRLINQGYAVVGLDNVNDYYDTALKFGRLKETGIEEGEVSYNTLVTSKRYANYRFIKLNLEDKSNIDKLFAAEKFDLVCNLAAQPGVRYSLENPDVYVQSNIVGFLNILEGCRHYAVKHLVYASSSSVYGLNETMPFSTEDNVDHPISLYAASKKSNELMAHTYSHLFNLPTTGLRFFVVYGPWGRPDMALFSFTESIIQGKAIKVFNNGEMLRDFTYVDDIVEGIVRVLENPAQGEKDWNGKKPNPGVSKAPYKIYNIGNSKPIKLLDFITTVEEKLGAEVEKIMLPIQPGDVLSTFADTSGLEKDFNYKPNTLLKDGVSSFVDWYKDFYKI